MVSAFELVLVPLRVSFGRGAPFATLASLKLRMRLFPDGDFWPPAFGEETEALAAPAPKRPVRRPPLQLLLSSKNLIVDERWLWPGTASSSSASWVIFHSSKRFPRRLVSKYSLATPPTPGAEVTDAMWLAVFLSSC